MSNNTENLANSTTQKQASTTLGDDASVPVTTTTTSAGKKRPSTDASQNPHGSKATDVKATPKIRRTWQFTDPARLPAGSPSITDHALKAEIEAARQYGKPSPTKSSKKRDQKKLGELRKKAKEAEIEEQDMEISEEEGQGRIEQPNFGRASPAPEAPEGSQSAPSTVATEPTITQTAAPINKTSQPVISAATQEQGGKGGRKERAGKRDEDRDTVMGEPEDHAPTPHGPQHVGSTSPPQYDNEGGNFDHYSDNYTPLSPNRHDHYNQEERDYSMGGEEGSGEDDRYQDEDGDPELSDDDRANSESDEEYSPPPARNDVLQVEKPFPNYRPTPGLLLAFYNEEGRELIKREKGVLKAIHFLGNDFPQACPTKKRDNVTDTVYTTLNTDAEGVEILEAQPDRNLAARTLGQIEGSPGTAYVSYDITNVQRRTLRAQPVLNQTRMTVYTITNPLKNGFFATFLDGPTSRMEVTTRNMTKILDAYAKKLPQHAGVVHVLREFHDNLDIEGEYTDKKGFTALNEILCARGSVSKHADVITKEWILCWLYSPTRSIEGELKWINVLRKVTIEIKHVGKINERPAPIRFCASCLLNDHTANYCPYLEVEGWRANPPLPSVRGSRSSRGQGVRGRGFNITRGRGRGT